jgi:hypothetical protein
MDKLKMARRMMTKKEKKAVKVQGKGDMKIKYHTSPFDSVAWNNRKKAILARVKRQQEAAHARAVARKQAKLINTI